MEVLFDIGGTNSRVGVSEDGETIVQSEIVKTPKDFDEAVDLLTDRVKALANGQQINLAVMGVAAPVTRDKTELANQGNIHSWFGRPVSQIFSDRLGVPTYLENDAILAALGEAGFGAGKGYDIVGYLTFSTGVGGAKVVNGQSDPRRYGFEPAYMITHANMDNSEDGLKDEIGHRLDGWFIEETFNKKPEEIDDPKFWDNIIRLMAITINNSVVLWSPDVIVIGGGLTKSIEIEKVTEATAKIFRAFPELPELKLAELGDFGGLYGALQMAKYINKIS